MTMHQSSLNLRSMAEALGGDVAGPNSILAPGPGHSPKDRSLSVKLTSKGPDGFTVYSHAGDDWKDCRDYVKEKLGLPRWEPKPKPECQHSGRSGQKVKVAEYTYSLEDGTPYLKVIRFAPGPDGKKDFRQQRWNGSTWEWGKPKGPKVPYRLLDILTKHHAPVLIVEGEKDADNLHKLGLVATTAAEGAGKWTADLGKWFADRIVYILPDNDETGRKHAREVAGHLHGIAREIRVVPLPGLPEKGDVSDWLNAGGDEEALLAICDEAPRWSPDTEPAPEAPLRLLSYDEMASMPEAEWLVDGLLVEGTSALLFGKSNSFKSFLAIDITCSVATGRSWHGKSVQGPGPVLYVATEGSRGVGRQRIPGWMEAHDIPLEERRQVRLYPQEIALDSPQDIEALLSTCAIERALRAGDRNWTDPAGAFRLIVIDIFGASMNGPETSDETARLWVRHVNRILREVGCAVLVVAHTGWADDTRARMHTHFWGSFDTRLKAEGDKDSRTTVLTVDRHKDADSEGRWGFRLDETTLPNGSTTLFPRLSGDVEVSQHKRVSGKAATALQALSEALADHGRTMQGPNYPSSVVSLEDWKRMCGEHGLSSSEDPEALKKAFQRAKEKLIEDGHVRQFGSYAWRADGHG
ncbi:hypothetical protein Rumeso_04339 [Rubellimicrobium mesophilum DSM 19309]|uniref:AAA family ATPase n=1 Tax=Rubellimicrobium mesophilum DSM 19309 TaxID=442562 RepID=A0A017HIC1_9RHOB|nr:AAA family ATPase [Rubellimicrobium mesophilum]EYD74086.1 hypothetical protein Rumeso_04339 [Rubellimicrobium mesophilum DSM 19309]